MAKRKQVSRKVRFEVFKRDSFTCQYCGRKAPDVVLHVDHIKPVANGGPNNILNYVTSCIDCNSGKGAKELSDSSAIEKARKQTEILQERRAQIEMMRDWQLSLVDEECLAVESVNDLYLKLTDNRFCISESYKNSTIAPLVKKYGAFEVMEALRSGTASYGDANKALKKLSGICYCRSNKDAEKRVYLLNIFNKRFYNLERGEASDILKAGYYLGGDDFYNRAKEAAYTLSGSWSMVKVNFYNLVDDYRD